MKTQLYVSRYILKNTEFFSIKNFTSKNYFYQILIKSRENLKVGPKKNHKNQHKVMFLKQEKIKLYFTMYVYL